MIDFENQETDLVWLIWGSRPLDVIENGLQGSKVLKLLFQNTNLKIEFGHKKQFAVHVKGQSV